MVMNNPKEFSDQSGFSALVPESAGAGEAAARLRLWRAMEREQGETRRRRFVARAAVLGVTLFVALLAVPDGMDRQSLQLFGLAEAVAGSNLNPTDSGAIWYERTEHLQRVVVDPVYVRPLGWEVYYFDLSVTVERWIAVDGAVRTRTTYGTPQFPAGIDDTVFDLARLTDRYPVMKSVETLGTQERQTPYVPPWSAGVDGLRASMETQVRTSAGPLPSYVRMLDMTIRLLHQERDDPDHRALLIRVLASLDGLQVTAEEDRLVVSARYVVEEEAFEQWVVFDRHSGSLVSYSVERLATRSTSSKILETHHYWAPDDALATGEEPATVVGDRS